MNFSITPTAVIFDMDGVIFDTERVYLESCVEAAAELGLGDVRELCISCIGVTAEMTKKCFDEAIPNQQLCTGFWELARCKTREKLSGGMPVKDGARELLSLLYEKGVPIALASASRALYEHHKTPILRHFQMPNLISMSSLLCER